MTAESTSQNAADLYSVLTDVIAGHDRCLDGVTLRGIVKPGQPHDRVALAELERAVSEAARVIATGEVYGTLTSGEARILTDKLAESAGFRRPLVSAIVAKWAKEAREHQKKAGLLRPTMAKPHFRLFWSRSSCGRVTAGEPPFLVSPSTALHPT